MCVADRVLLFLGVLCGESCVRGVFFFQAEDGIRDRNVTGVQRVLFRSARHASCPVLREPWLPRAAISATRLARLATSLIWRPGSGASPRAASGTMARAKPSLAASLSRAAPCAAGRTAPDNDTSPK